MSTTKLEVKGIAMKLFPNMPISTDLLAQLLEASRTEDPAAVLVAAYKLGYKQGQEER